MTEHENQDDRVTRYLTWVAYVLTAVVGMTVLIVSAEYLHTYADKVGITGWMAWTLVVALEAGGAGGTLCWFIGRHRTRTVGMAVALANLVGSLAGNVLGHLLEVGDVAVTTLMTILTGVIYPAELWAMVHLAMLLREQNRPTPTPPVEVPAVPEPVVPTVDPVPTAPVYPTVSAPITPPVPTLYPPPVPVPTPRTHPVPAVPTSVPRYGNGGYTSRPTMVEDERHTEVTEELLDQARALRTRLAADRLPRGRTVLMDKLQVNDRVARELIRRLNAEPPVRLVAGAR